MKEFSYEQLMGARSSELRGLVELVDEAEEIATELGYDPERTDMSSKNDDEAEVARQTKADYQREFANRHKEIAARFDAGREIDLQISLIREERPELTYEQALQVVKRENPALVLAAFGHPKKGF